MSYLRAGAVLDHDGRQWTALPLEHSRWLDYHGPSVVQSDTGDRLFAKANPDGSVVLHEVLTEDGKTTYGKGPTGQPGKEKGRSSVRSDDLFEDEWADADPTCTQPGGKR